MPQQLEGAALALIADKNYATLSTLRVDGSIQSVVIWADVDAEGRVVVNSAEGRAWPTNLRRNGQATISVINPENAQEFVSVTGTVVVDTQEDGDQVINELSHKYIGVDYPLLGNGDVRVTFRLQPTRVSYKAP